MRSNKLCSFFLNIFKVTYHQNECCSLFVNLFVLLRVLIRALRDVDFLAAPSRIFEALVDVLKVVADVKVWFWFSNDSYQQNYDQHRQTIAKISVGEHHLKNILKNFQIILAINFKSIFSENHFILSITEEKLKMKNSLMIPHLLIKWLIHRLFRRFFGEISFNCKIWLTVRFLMSKTIGFSQCPMDISDWISILATSFEFWWLTQI